jgi:hypothetical protein
MKVSRSKRMPKRPDPGEQALRQVDFVEAGVQLWIRRPQLHRVRCCLYSGSFAELCTTSNTTCWAVAVSIRASKTDTGVRKVVPKGC